MVVVVERLLLIDLLFNLDKNWIPSMDSDSFLKLLYFRL